MKNSPPFRKAVRIGTVPVALLGIALFSSGLRAQSTGLTSEQLANIRGQLEEIRMLVDGRNSDLNRSAGSVFRQASQDPKAAVTLYAQCYKMVNFEREGREEKEYRDWEDGQKENFKDPRFIEGLMVQLRYLALSCEAAEADELKDVFPTLLGYVDGLSNLTELPSPQLLQGVNGSVFSKAYKLEELLSRNREWDMVPFNIDGIYEKTILPYLRAEDPASLIGAWDRRIAQQTKMAQFLSSLEEKGNNREERQRAENRGRQLQQGRTGELVRSYNEVDFLENTLPALNWGRHRDMALYVDTVQGVSGLLSFVKENTEHPKVSDWLDDLDLIVEQIASARDAAISAAPAEPIPATPAPPVAPTTTTTNTGPRVTGSVPPGLE